MRVSTTCRVVCWALLVVLPSSLMGQSPVAIIHAQGGVWVNGSEARDAAAIFVGDVLETKTGFSATLNLEGVSVLLRPETVATLDNGVLALDHGSVSVGTNVGFKVRVNCLTVVPVLNDWTQYDVTDLNGTVQVAASKKDVNVDRTVSRRKPGSEGGNAQGAAVHEGQQGNYDESQLCGAPARTTGAGWSVSPKWIAVGGAGGTAVLICLLVLCQGNGGKQSISPSSP